MRQIGLFVKSIVKDKRLVFYGLVLLALHVSGMLLLYRLFSEFDVLPHFWFGFVLSEYSSRGSASLNLQSNLAARFQKHGWNAASFGKVDFLVRLTGFLLVGGLFWEWAELFFSPLLGIEPDSFFAFPITLRNIDGALDVTMGIIGATLAFLIDTRRRKRK